MKDGYPDKTKFECHVKTGLDSSFSNGSGYEIPVVAFLPVPNEPTAMQILVAQPLRDNANASVLFKDKRTKTGSIDTTNTVNFRLADAREPSVLSVESSGTKKIEITFSEAVLPHLNVTDLTKSDEVEGGTDLYAAQNLSNYLIDGKPLSAFGIESIEREKEIADVSSSELKRTSKKFELDESFKAKDGKVTLQSYTVKEKTGTDNRHKVTITVGSGHVLPTGNHMLTVKNVGDWAARYDASRNTVSTQVLPFTVTENADKPAFTVEVQSPEQYKLNFNTEFKVADEAEHFVTRDSSAQDTESVLELQEKVNGTWTTISDNSTAQHANPIAVSRIGDDETKYLAEVRRDWSEVYDFDSTRTDYYNKELRLHVDAGKLVNVSNNIRNDEINIELNANTDKVTNGSIMKEADLTSPSVVGITQASAVNGSSLHSWNVELSEPVKISSDANQEGLTPSQKQSKGVKNAAPEDKLTKNQGVPVAFARFVNVDSPSTIVEGIVDESAFVDAEDKVINVAPEKRLSGGNWRLVVGSISDDYGSTLATAGDVIVVDETTASTDFKVVWAAVSQTKKYDEERMGRIDTDRFGARRGSYVFVKFNKAVDMATALDENNYTLNNQPLPHGANIYANIEGYDEHDGVLDSVTIALPTQSNLLYGAYDVDILSTQLSISGVVAAGTGEALSGSSMNQLPYNIGENAGNVTSNSNLVSVPGVLTESDAVWGNDPKEIYFDTWAEYYEALRDALDDDKYRKVKIRNDAFDELDGTDETDNRLKAARAVFGKNLIIDINRAVDVDFQGATLYGNVVVSTSDAVDEMRIQNVDIMGTTEEVRGYNASLTVNAGVIRDFVLDEVNVYTSNDTAYPIILNNVWTESFKVLGNSSINSKGTARDNKGVIYVTDSDGFGFYNDSAWDGFLIINAGGDINLKGGFSGVNITLEKAATLNLGVREEDGSVKPGNDIILDGSTNIRINGSEAKVMITNASTLTQSAVTNGETPNIEIAGKDVKVYAETGKENWVKNDGGTIIPIDIKGKKLPAGNTLETSYANTANKGGMVKILDSLTSIEESVSYSDIVSAGAIFGKTDYVKDGKITINRTGAANSIIDEIETKAKTEGFVNANGTEITSDDVKVSVSLSRPSDAKLFAQTTTEIKSKDPVGTGEDVLVITVTYAGNTYTRNMKVTN